jgi:hypothetical protein
MHIVRLFCTLFGDFSFVSLPDIARLEQ